MTANFEPEDAVALQRSIARSEGLNTVSTKIKSYLPLYKHPLPVSDSRFAHEDSLRKILSCKVSFQGIAAITKGDAWALESVYMHNGIAALKGKNGSDPIHLAVQSNSIDCVMVLINIGVDLNAKNSHGFTPLFLANSAGLLKMKKLLIENGAKLTVERIADQEPAGTILDVIPEKGSGRIVNSTLSKYLNQPDKSTLF